MAPHQIQTILKLLPNLSETQLRDLYVSLEEHEVLAKRELAADSFMAFVKKVWPTFVEGAHHRKMARAFERVASGECKRLIINMPPRHAVLTSMKIPTPMGFKTMADLQVGDHVFGPDGLPVAVLGKSEIFRNRQLYRVWTDDGSYLDVDGEHLWTVRLDRKYKAYNNYTTEQLWRRQQGEVVRVKRNGETEFLSRRVPIQDVRLPRLPDVAPVQYADTDLLVDPYVLGLWLGDGTALQAIMTMHTDDAALVRPEIERRGYTTTDQRTRFSFGILDLKVKLRELGVLGNKHIPAQYMTASKAQRRDLLKGLMDTDGNVAKGGQCFFAQSNKALCIQVQELIRSLGIKANLLESRAVLNGKDYGPTWRVSFYASDIAFLPRKESRTSTTKFAFGRYIRVEKLKYTGDTQCIKVDRADGLFLAGEGYICTHNTKSEFASYLLPAWFLGKFPQKKVIQTSHTAELAVGFGRKVRNLVDQAVYTEVFPKLALQADSKAAGRWNTSAGGDYFAIGVGGAVTGKGADLLIIDDPHSEQEAALAEVNPDIYDKTYEWYTSGPRQRLQPGGAIVIVMTRWSLRDLSGQVLKAAAQRGGEEWEVIEFPAILPSGAPLWPQFWSLAELEALREELPSHKWNAQYQQSPTAREGSLIKKEWWRLWESDTPPYCEFIIQTWDTAFEKTSRADYSACTTWGVFNQSDESTGNENVANIILLDAFRDRMEFPELKQTAYKHYKEWDTESVPVSLLVEKKASGAPLIYELRAAGIPVQEYTPSRGNDKISRLNSVTDIFASGRVWVPQTRWAEEVMDEVAAFPAGEHDDYVDALTLALMRFRSGGFVRTELDEPEPKRQFKSHRNAGYY